MLNARVEEGAPNVEVDEGIPKADSPPKARAEAVAPNVVVNDGVPNAKVDDGVRKSGTASLAIIPLAPPRSLPFQAPPARLLAATTQKEWERGTRPAAPSRRRPVGG